MHCCVLRQSVAAPQFGFGRVSVWHAPWLQYLPAPHCASVVHEGAQVPFTHDGAVTGQVALVVHVVPVGTGWQAPFTQVVPAPQVVAEQSSTHCPSAHTFPGPHSLEYLQVFASAVQTPATHDWPVAQSACPVQAHGPCVPPQVGPESWPGTHFPASQTFPAVQSLVPVQLLGVPGIVPGGTQSPDLQTVPARQSPSTTHTCVHPLSVQIEPLEQLTSPVQGAGVGLGTSRQE
jgi:hypothetical protein